MPSMLAIVCICIGLFLSNIAYHLEFWTQNGLNRLAFNIVYCNYALLEWMPPPLWVWRVRGSTVFLRVAHGSSALPIPSFPDNFRNLWNFYIDQTFEKQLQNYLKLHNHNFGTWSNMILIRFDNEYWSIGIRWRGGRETILYIINSGFPASQFIFVKVASPSILSSW